MHDYAAAAEGADLHLAECGTSMTLTRSTSSGTPAALNFTDTTYTVTAFKYDDKATIDGVLRHVTKFIIAPTADVEPQTDDVITDADGIDYKLFLVSKFSPTGTKVLFTGYAGTQ